MLIDFRFRKEMFADVFDQVQICHIANPKNPAEDNQLYSRIWGDMLRTPDENKSKHVGESLYSRVDCSQLCPL